MFSCDQSFRNLDIVTFTSRVENSHPELVSTRRFGFEIFRDCFLQSYLFQPKHAQTRISCSDIVMLTWSRAKQKRGRNWHFTPVGSFYLQALLKIVLCALARIPLLVWVLNGQQNELASLDSLFITSLSMAHSEGFVFQFLPPPSPSFGKVSTW